ncbi:Wadjet anti-phage system protein JetD domain-containing protein [Archangium sp.]|uniref:Wadjet anti-phage system protein JetD domain-containing protein n=1 Tax=Archangium sp. TaxID=1872627 RepID=UPI002D479475|nr:Wadjet anti-phage system protein JetD domain-containing protein [Archangium sp.]HYO60161.1 Wadjet anti-phage system protein JetD domain-containing protein [Archangium sp.]
MRSPGSSAWCELLTRLLDAYEKSAMYRRDAPWPRQVRVRLGSSTFPDAFAPDGREWLAELRAAADDLEREGAVAVIRSKGGFYESPEPKEVRLGPEHVTRAYALARSVSYEPLEVSLKALSTHAEALSARTAVPWVRSFLSEVSLGLARGEGAPLVGSRERLKHEWRDWHDALTAMVALAGGEHGWERVVSERLFTDSKRLGSIRGQVAGLMARVDPRFAETAPEEPQEVLEAYGIRRRPGLLRCSGCAEMHVGGRLYRLEDFSPSAHLPEAWAEAWISSVVEARVDVLTTVENEYPFLAYIEEAGGPCALGERRELVVYTGGFPTPVLSAALGRIAVRRPDLRFRHWGDADTGGVQIWWHLRRALGRELELFRTTPGWVEQHQERAQQLTAAERSKLKRLGRALHGSAEATSADVLAAGRLIEVLLSLGIKVEQERY